MTTKEIADAVYATYSRCYSVSTTASKHNLDRASVVMYLGMRGITITEGMQ